MCHGFLLFVFLLLFVALVVFIIFSIDGLVFMLSDVMHSPNVVSSLFGCFWV